MNYFERHVLETLIYLPMLAALVLVFVPRPRKDVIRWISIGSGLALLVRRSMPSSPSTTTVARASSSSVPTPGWNSSALSSPLASTASPPPWSC